MKDLFYSPDEQLLFWVAGYGYDSTYLHKLIDDLQEGATKFLAVARKIESKIQTDMITHSRRYKSMRVFWAKTQTVPEEAFVIGTEEHKWTMWEWLTD